MKDYEQLYYNLLFEFKKIKHEKENVEEELNIVKKLNKCKTKNEIAKFIASYLKRQKH